MPRVSPEAAELIRASNPLHAPVRNGRSKEIEPTHVGVYDAEARSGVSAWSWRHMAYSGRIASCKVGKRLLIPIAEIDRILAEGYRPALTPNGNGNK